MIDLISGEEPPVELGDETVRNFGVPHPGWFLSTIVLQFFVLFFIAAAKLHAMPQSTVLKVEAFADYTSRDRFRGNYIHGIILYPAKSISLPNTQFLKSTLLVFDTTTVSKGSSKNLAAKMIRIDTSDSQLGTVCHSPSEVALKAIITPRFSSGRRMLSVETAPFFIAEDACNSLCLREDQRAPATFELAVDKDGNTKILSVDTSHWLSSHRSQ